MTHGDDGFCLAVVRGIGVSGRIGFLFFQRGENPGEIGFPAYFLDCAGNQGVVISISKV